MTMLEVKGLTKRFGGLAAVNNFDISVPEGEIRGIIGPNGAGKTTLFNLISGAYRPTAGEIRFKGETISGKKPSFVAEKGLIRTFQRNAMFPTYSVLDNVMLSRHLLTQENIFKAILGLDRKKEAENLERSREIIAFMELSEFENELASNLSHGHQRILGIANALAVEPKLLMLDEPVAVERVGREGERAVEVVVQVDHACSLRHRCRRERVRMVRVADAGSGRRSRVER